MLRTKARAPRRSAVAYSGSATTLGMTEAMAGALKFGELLRYAGAAAIVLVAALLRLSLDPWLHSYSPFLFFIAAILAVSFLCGTGPAIVASILAAGLGVAFAGSGPLELSVAISVATFLATAAGLIWVTELMKRARVVAETSTATAIERADTTASTLEELNLLIDGAQGIALYMVDTTGQVTIWNAGAERLKGWSEAEIVGQPMSLFYPADAVARGKPEADLEVARRTGRLDEEDWRVRKDGSEFLASVSITSLYDRSQALRGYAKIVRDITDQRAAENALRASEEHFRSILSTVPDAMIVIDDHGTITSFSVAAEQLFGYPEREVVGTNVSRLMPSPDAERHDGYLERYLKSGERQIIGIGRTVQGLKADGTIFPMELAVGEALTGKERLFTGFIRDLTQKQATEDQMRSLQSELIHVSRISAMGTMASTLAHELNQPITAVANYVEGVRDLLSAPDEGDMPMIREALGDAAKEAMRAGDIVRRLRDFVSRGEIERTVEPLPELVREAAVLGLMGAREKGVEVRFEIDPLASPVLVDKVQIQQVLINLVRNAVESMANTPTRLLSIRTAIESASLVRVTVSDTGTGISPDLASALFTAFVTTKREGMGLGLSICRTIVEAHGGKIWVEANAGGDSAFHFTLARAGGEDEDGG